MLTARVDGYDLHYTELGSGIPLVLVHGSLGDQRWWCEHMAPLACHYRVISVSLRHCWPERWDGNGDDFNANRQALDISELIQVLKLGPVHLLGLSRGGYIAYRVAVEHPELIRRLILAEPSGPVDPSLFEGLPPSDTQVMPLGQLFADVAENIRNGRIDEGLAPAVAAIDGSPTAWQDRPEWMRQIMRDNARTMLGQFRETRAPFTRVEAQSIQAPTLLLKGEHSPRSFHRIVDGFLAALPYGRQAVIPNAYHAMNIDNPSAFTREVLAFLA